jgi:hypothetical protein
MAVETCFRRAKSLWQIEIIGFCWKFAFVFSQCYSKLKFYIWKPRETIRPSRYWNIPRLFLKQMFTALMARIDHSVKPARWRIRRTNCFGMFLDHLLQKIWPFGDRAVCHWCPIKISSLPRVPNLQSPVSL